MKPLDYEPGKRHPLIVTTYRSGGFLRGAVGDEFPIQLFAARGFAVLDFDAPPDPLFYFLAGNAWQNLFARWGLGGPLEDGETARRWQEVSPALNARKLRAALLINASENEYRIGLQLYTALRQQRKPVEYVIYPGEDHVKNQPAHRQAIYERNVDWAPKSMASD